MFVCLFHFTLLEKEESLHLELKYYSTYDRLLQQFNW
jgi:hypothetical protein